MEPLYYAGYECRFGRLLLVASERGLLHLQLPPEDGGEAQLPAHLAEAVPSVPRLQPYLAQLREYFAGYWRKFTFPLDLRGTDFQQRCWRALLQIPYGEIRTYAQVAAAVGCPRGFRAVGMANHDNPLAIVVPCHRVIASDGSLGGYGGGLQMKRKLLEMEGARLGPVQLSLDAN
jgi:methylated-DNA-[protein]-cysteine S-methyltransferase